MAGPRPTVPRSANTPQASRTPIRSGASARIASAVRVCPAGWPARRAGSATGRCCTAPPCPALGGRVATMISAVGHRPRSARLHRPAAPAAGTAAAPPASVRRVRLGRRRGVAVDHQAGGADRRAPHPAGSPTGRGRAPHTLTGTSCAGPRITTQATSAAWRRSRAYTCGRRRAGVAVAGVRHDVAGGRAGRRPARRPRRAGRPRPRRASPDRPDRTPATAGGRHRPVTTRGGHGGRRRPAPGRRGDRQAARSPRSDRSVEAAGQRVPQARQATAVGRAGTRR